jgi:hypothetical protein
MTLFLAILGPILSLIGLLAGYVYYRNNKKYMELSYEILPTQTLSEGEGVQEFRALIRNTGTLAVENPKETSVETPVTLCFEPQAHILHASEGTRIVPNSGKVVLEPLLLNPGQETTIAAVVRQFEGRVTVVAHIKDVTVIGIERSKHVPLPNSIEDPEDAPLLNRINAASRIFNRLPPLHKRKDPLLAALLGFLLAGIGLGLYFWSWRDFAIVFVAYFVFTWLTGSGILPIFGIAIAASLYGYLRAYNSNLRLSAVDTRATTRP